ncbi:MAG TPA: hypothetical protein VMX14_13225 [Anaerolineae bacterium]|nr:hypothetical protein [Anaerolineae bacterium]
MTTKPTASDLYDRFAPQASPADILAMPLSELTGQVRNLRTPAQTEPSPDLADLTDTDIAIAVQAHAARQIPPAQFTNDDVRDAYFTDHCQDIADAQHTKPETIVTADLIAYDDDNQIDQADTASMRQEELNHFHNGQRILETARLVIGRRYVPGTAKNPLQSPDAPTIIVSAGHIATAEAVRQVTLHRK